MNLPNLFDGELDVQVLLCQPDKSIMGEITPYDLQGTFKFNTYSEISFTIDRYYNDLIDGTVKVNPYYDYIDSLRVIYLRGIGHFVIQDVDRNIEDKESKSVACFSLEYSTGQKYLENFYVNTGEEGSVEVTYHTQIHGVEYSIDNYYELNTKEFDAYQRYYIKQYDDNDSYNYVEEQIFDANHFATYDGKNSETTLYVKAYPNVRFYWPTNPELSLLHLVFDRIPEWKIGHVDSQLWFQERTFSEDRTAVYDFLYNTAAETLDFVMVWDSINGVVHFFKAEEDGVTVNTYVQTNMYKEGITYYTDDKGTLPIDAYGNYVSPTKEQVETGQYYINIGTDIETQWDTDVFISKENLANSIDVSYSTDDIKTKLKITGSDDLDVRDVNLGQNYILNLDFYHDVEWMGPDLWKKYGDYTKALKGYTAEYKKLVSAWAAAYNEYSDLMNNVPVEPSVLMIGDYFDKLYCVYNFYNSLTQNEVKEMIEFQNGGNVDLFNRPQIPSSKLADVGWENAGDKTSTVFTITYANEDGTIAINVTPILPDGDVMHPGDLEDYALGLIYDEITDDYKLQIGSMFIGDNAISEAEEAAERIHELQQKYYLSVGRTTEDLVTSLSNKLKTYKVDLDDNSKWSSIAKTDDVLLTLENDQSDSVTIRVRHYEKVDNNDTNESGYYVYRTLTTVSTGLSNTKQYSLTQWVNGELTAKELELTDSKGNPVFKVKSIGTLGAYMCLAKDETVEANLEEYGIRLLEEKEATYTKIFITQTEGYMSQEGSRCIASDEEPKGAIAKGDKWLDTDSSELTIRKCINPNATIFDEKWEAYSPEENEVDFQNYARFDENYRKLQAVQAVLVKKQRIADYLLNGIAVSALHITDANISDDNGEIDVNKLLYSLLRASVLHFIALDHALYISDQQPSGVLELGDVWIRTLTPTGEPIIYKYEQIDNDKKWVQYTELANDIKNILLTNISTEDKYLTFVLNPKYTLATTYKEEVVYYIRDSIDTTSYWLKPNAQPTEDTFADREYYIMDGIEYVAYLNGGTPYVAYARSQGLCLSKMNTLKEKSDMNNFFNEKELIRLSPFIREDEYSDSNFLLVGTESEEEQMSIKQELLNRGIEELTKISKPKLSFNMTMANILAIPEFTPLKNQFKLGNFVTVGLREPYTIKGNSQKARLLEVNINFEDVSDFSCTFGDLLTTRSLVDKHAQLLEQAVSAGKTVASNQSKWQKGADKANSIDKAIDDGLASATLEVGRANGQSLVWGDQGIWCRKLVDGTTDQYDPEQIRIVNNKILYSTDGFRTSSSAFGSFEYEGQTYSGVIAKALVGGFIQGSEIRGGHLEIGGDKGKFIVHEDGSMQVFVKENNQDKEIKLDTLNPLGDAYRYTVELSYNTSTIFNTETASTTITATLKEWGKTPTTPLNNITYSWKRSSSKADEDTIWNNDPQHQNLTTNTITITPQDFDNNAQFFCEVTFTESTTN